MRTWIKKIIREIFEKWIIALGILLLGLFSSAVVANFKLYKSVPEEIRLTNERITRDSILAEKKLHDSITVFRGAMGNLRDRLAVIENEDRKIKTKKIK